MISLKSARGWLVNSMVGCQSAGWIFKGSLLSFQENLSKLICLSLFLLRGNWSFFATGTFLWEKFLLSDVLRVFNHYRTSYQWILSYPIWRWWCLVETKYVWKIAHGKLFNGPGPNTVPHSQRLILWVQQAAQRTLPHALQWCRRSKKEKRAEHSMQLSHSASGIQKGAACKSLTLFTNYKNFFIARKICRITDFSFPLPKAKIPDLQQFLTCCTNHNWHFSLL